MAIDSHVSWVNVAVLTVGLALVVACTRERSDTQSSNAPSQQEADGRAQPAASAQSKYEEGAFVLSIDPSAEMKASGQGELSVVMSAKSPFHVNAEYPHRFKVLGVKGGTIAGSTIPVDPKRLSESQLSISIPVSLSQPGQGEVEGEMAFSVCTKEKCLMEKRVLRATFPIR